MQDAIHYKNRTGAVGAVHPADAHHGCSPRTAGIGDRKPRHLALQRCDRVGGWHAGDLVSLHRTHRARKIPTTLRTESDHDDLIDLALRGRQ